MVGQKFKDVVSLMGVFLIVFLPGMAAGNQNGPIAAMFVVLVFSLIVGIVFSLVPPGWETSWRLPRRSQRKKRRRDTRRRKSLQLKS